MFKMYPSGLRGRRRSLLLGLLLVLPAISGLAGQESHSEGTLWIHNTAQPANGVESLRLEEMWRAGGVDDDETIFGLITRVRSDDAGNLYLLDAQLQQVYVFDPEGNPRGTLYREGDGPGEITWGCDLMFLPDGDLGVTRRFPGSVVTVATDGTPTTHGFGGKDPRLSFASGESAGGNIVIGGVVSKPGEHDGAGTRTNFLASFSPGGDEQVRYTEKSWSFDYHNNFTFKETSALADFLYSYAVGPDGRVYTLPDRERYVVKVFNTDGSVDRIIEREFTPRQRTNVERARIQALVDRRFRTFPFDLTVELADSEAAVPWYYRGLQVAPDGSLWVRHSQSAEAVDALIVFDVFDPEGHYRKQVAVPVPGNAMLDGVFLAGSDRLVVVHGFVDCMRMNVGGGRGPIDDGTGDPQPVEVVCYRIVQ